MASNASRGASAASFSPRLGQSATAVPEAIPCQVTGGPGEAAPASSHFPMVSESGRTGSAPALNGTAKSRRLPPASAGYSAVCPAAPTTTSRSGAAPSRTATAPRHAVRRRSSSLAAGSEAPVTSGTSSGGCGQTAAAISIWSSRKGYLTCQNSLLRTAVPDGRGGGDPHGHARTETAGSGGAAAPVLLVLVGICLQVQLHEHRMHDGPLTWAGRPPADRSVSREQKYVLPGKTPAGINIHRAAVKIHNPHRIRLTEPGPRRRGGLRRPAG